MLQAFDSVIREVGPLAFLALGFAALVEYLLPPFPGDSVVLLGGVYAVRGQQPYWLVFAAVLTGSVLGALANFAIGQWLGKVVERDPSREKFLGISLQSLRHAEARMRKYGDWALAANRFIPGIRGLFFVAAGMSGMRRARVLLLGALSASVHTALLLAVGIELGGNLERIEAFVGRWQRVSIGVVVAVMIALLAGWLWRRRKHGVAAP